METDKSKVSRVVEFALCDWSDRCQDRSKRPDSYIIIVRDFSNKYFGKNESTNDSVVLRTSELQKI